MKRWIDANEIGMVNELPTKKLREIDIEMRKKPNFEYENQQEFKKKKNRPNKLECKNK